MKANKNDYITPFIVSRHFNKLKFNSGDCLIIDDELGDDKENS